MTVSSVSSTGLGSISSPGIGSGLDINSIVTQLVNAEKQPLTLLQQKGSGLQAKLSAYGQVKSGLSGLDDAGTALIDSSTWNNRTFTSNNSSITGTATSSALVSSFSVQVNALAQVQSVKSAGQTSGSAIGADGRLDIQVGQWSGTSFAGGSNAVTSVSVAATDTLSDIATKINNAGSGVSAVVVTNNGKDQLLVRGNNTGDASGFQIRSYDSGSTEITDGSTGVGKLAYTYNSGTSSFVGLSKTQSAQNASLTIDGIAVSSSTNQVSDAVPGVTLNLTATTSTPAQITVGLDKDAIKSKISGFVTAYNSIRTTLNSLLAYDSAAKTAGALQGDGTAQGLQSMLRNLVGANGPSGTTFSRLSDLGIQMQRDGTLTTNATKLDTALQNPTAVQTFLSAASGTSSTDGIARRIRDFARAADQTDGTVTTRGNALQSAIDRNSRDIDNMNTRIASIQTALYKQYNTLDTNLGKISSLSSFVTQQITQWNKSSA
jgi:flagellar hook-associated protein 2